jgi:Mn-dependent DtxR family transcriptional regulator
MHKRQLVAAAIRADPACSDRSLAHDLGVSRNLVTRMRRELAAAGETVLGLPVRGRDGLTYQYKTQRVSRVAELDRICRRLYPVVQVVESEEFARTYRTASETQRGVLRRIVERLRKRLDGLDRLLSAPQS